MALLGVLLLASPLLASTRLEGRFDSEAILGSLVLRGETEAVLATREGWEAEEVDALPGTDGLVLVQWRPQPRRQHLEPELWRLRAGGAEKVWPAEGEVVTWYRGDVAVRARPEGVTLLVRRAEVADNFDAPLLERRERYVVEAAGALRLEKYAYGEARSRSQRRNLLAALLRDGHRRKAAALRARWTKARAPRQASREAATSEPVPAPSRRALVALADARGPHSYAAAEALLALAVDGAQP